MTPGEFAKGAVVTLAVSLLPQVAVAAALDAAAAAGTLALSAELSALSQVSLKGVIQPGTNRLLSTVWGSGEAQSARALKTLQEGGAMKLPSIPKEQLIAYRELISRQFLETPRPIHEIRMKIVDILIRR